MKRQFLLLVILSLSISFGVSAQRQSEKSYIQGEMLVQMAANTSLKTLLQRAPGYFQMDIEKMLSPQMRIWLITFDHNAVGHKQMQQWLYSQPEIAVAQNNHYVYMRSTLPGDPNINQQWHHNNTGQTGGTVDADIDSDLVWDITTGGQTATNDDIVVCLIESGGGNLNHADLTANRWTNAGEAGALANNGIDDDGNGYIDDFAGWNVVTGNDSYGNSEHGTNCLGMIGAKGNNNLSVAGANWNVKLMVVDMGGASEAGVIAAYTYPLTLRQQWNNSGGTEGAFVVATSASWGIDGANPNNYPLWCQFYDTLGYYGILNVGAPTNQNLDVDTAGDMPTACTSDYMIGVGRTDHNDNTAGGYGDQTIELGAPGISVVTTSGTTNGSAGITTATGTSFACPLTAGVIGLAYSISCTDFMSLVVANPQQAADIVLQALMNGTDQKPQLSTRFVTGGRLNAFNMIDNLMTTVCDGIVCVAPGSLSFSSVTDVSADITFTTHVSGTSSTLYWREVGAATWTEVPNATSPVALTGLTACTAYEFYMESVCDTTTSGTTITRMFSTSGCGNCIDLSYCTGSATDGLDEWIETVAIGTYTNNSGNDNGYGDYMGTSAISLTLNSTYNITITPGWNGAQYDEQSRVWIDYDQSGTFDAGELVYDQGVATQTPATGSITIPGTATLGITRMRIQMAYIGTEQDMLPGECESFIWGEVEDYCVTIENDVVCGYTTSETVVHPDCNGTPTGSITVDNITGGMPNYVYDWGTAGGNVSEISGLAAGNYTVTITDQALCDTTIFFTLIDPPAIAVTETIVQPDCNGASTGSITVGNISNGTPDYTLDWGTFGGNVTSITGLSAGLYTLTVTDNAACVRNFNYNVTDPAQHTAGFTSSTASLTATFANTSVGGGTYTWDFDDLNTSTEVNPVHTYTQEGTYNVCLVATTACGIFQTCNDVTVGISGLEDEDNYTVVVYPNPTEGLLNFTITNPTITTIEITDVVGKVVRYVKVEGKDTELDLSSETVGTYFYRLRDTNGVVICTNKIVVMH